MAMPNMDMPVNVPIDDPNADTEWNDILRKHGVIPERPPSPTAKIQEALSEARELAHQNRLEGKDIDELAALEDDEDKDFLASYKQKRLAELAAIQSASRYGSVYPVQKVEYAEQVTAESSKAVVLVLLTSSNGMNTQSKLAEGIWREAAGTFGDVKFVQMRADLCIEGYPDRNTPTILVYKDGEIVRQLVTLRELDGDRMDIRSLEGLLKDVGAVNHGDARLQSRNDPGGKARPDHARGGDQSDGDDDDDDDDHY